MSRSRILLFAAAACEVISALDYGGVLPAGAAAAWLAGGLAAFFAAGA